MKRKIDINKINHLLEQSRNTQKELAEFISYPTTNLASALNNNRALPMDYILSIADFFQVNPKDLTICVNETISSIPNEKQLQVKGCK